LATIDEAVAIAFEHHAAGRVAAAEEIYRRVLAVDADNRSANRLLGLLLLDTDRAAAALGPLTRATIATPLASDLWVDTARARHATRDPGGAERALRRALALDPASTTGWTMAGIAARARGVGPTGPTLLARALVVETEREETLGRFLLLAREYGGARADAGDEDAALHWFRRAIEVAPEDPVGHFRLACVLVRFHRLVAAERAFRRAAALVPGDAETWSRFGATAGSRRLPSIAEARRAALIRPDDAPARLHIADAAIAGKRPDIARRAIEIHLALDPASTAGWTARHLISPAEAGEPPLRRALVVNPDDSHANARLGLCLDGAGKGAEALALYDAVIARDPLCAEARWARSFHLLRGGDYERGWEDYEWRFRAATSAILRREISGPEWNGGPLRMGPLLLHAEQGLGDTLQMLRLVNVARERAGVPVVVEVQAPLVSLLREGLATADVTIVERAVDFPFEAGLPPREASASLMSLPRLLRLTSAEKIPGRAPWLVAPPSRRARWAERLERGDGPRPLRCGLVWAGNPDHPRDKARSLTTAALARLLADGGETEFVSFQLGPARERRPTNLPRLIDPMDDARDFADTAAALGFVDLLITVDTAPAHLGGALGVPVWLLLPTDPDFRWGDTREDAPWYPSIRVFRQTSAGDWDSVVDRVTAELKHVTEACLFS